MKNTLADLNGYLFERLESISSQELTEQELEMEIKKSETVTKLAAQIVNNADLVLKAEKMKVEWLGPKSNGLKMLGLEND